MNTTNLFVELIVIGMAAVVWLAFVASSVFSLNPLELLSTILSAGSLGPTVAVSYVLGIAVDRLADFLFQWRDHKLRAQRFSSSDYQQARTVIYPSLSLFRTGFSIPAVGFGFAAVLLSTPFSSQSRSTSSSGLAIRRLSVLS